VSEVSNAPSDEPAIPVVDDVDILDGRYGRRACINGRSRPLEAGRAVDLNCSFHYYGLETERIALIKRTAISKESRDRGGLRDQDTAM